jgi:uncharacterized protein
VKQGFKVMDSDLHVIEDAHVYARHMPEAFRERAPRHLGLSPTNFPHWEVEGRLIPPWARDPQVVGAQAALDARNAALYAPVRERGYDAASTRAAMDAEGIDEAVLLRTFAHMVVSLDDLDGAYATACCRAFNEWLTAYCQADPRRLHAAAIVSLHDPARAADEARRAVREDGAVAVVVLPMPVAGRYLHSPECDVLWAEIERLRVPLIVHGTSGGASRDYVSNRYVDHPNFRTLNHASAFPQELMLAMGALLVGGVLERFQHLKVGFLEGNCGWLPWWLARLDDQWRKYGAGEAVKLGALPSEYFARQCWIGTDVDEPLLPQVVDALGDERIVLSTDYPHADGPYPNGVLEFLEREDVGGASKRRILWDNCRQLYGMAV